MTIRRGVPSASAAARDLLCPGSHLATRDIPDLPNQWSETGNRVHEAFLKQVPPSAGHDLELYNRAVEIEVKVLNTWLDSYCDTYERIYSKRYWARGRNDVPLCSGEVDVLYIAEDHSEALIEDLKSLYGPVDDSDTNQQLRDLAALVWLHYGFKPNVTVFINQPNVTTKPKLTRYVQEDLNKAWQQMIFRVTRSMDPGSPRIPGETQCRWCKAKPTCPEARQALTVAIPEKWEMIPPDKKLWLWDRCQLAQAVIDSIKERIAGDLENNPDSIPGLARKPDTYSREVIDASGLSTRIGSLVDKRFGMKAWDKFEADFQAAMTIGVSEVEELIAKHLDIQKKEASKLLAQEAAEFILRKPRKGHIVRTKAA